MERRVVISGLNCITSLGNDIEEIWCALLDGVTGISKIDKFDISKYPCQFGGEIKNFNARKAGLTGTNTMLKYNQYELVSIMRAIEKYNWIEDLTEQKINCPIYLGNQCINLDQELYDTLIDISEDEETLDFSLIGKNLNKFPPLNGIKLLPTLPMHFVAKKYDFHGSANISYAGESSSIGSILHAMRDIRMGYYEKAIVASTYGPFTPHEFLWLGSAMLSRKTTYTDEPNQLLFPFDRRHQGIIYGEGAGVLLIESERSALENGRSILAYIRGGTTNVYPEGNFFELSPKGFANNIKSTLRECGARSTDIDLIYANAPSYANWDNAEIEAIAKIWNEECVAIMSSKLNLGFLGCTAGIIDCILAVKSLRENKFARLKNFEQFDSGLDLEYKKYFGYTLPNINRCLVNSAGSGAQYSSIILEKGM